MRKMINYSELMASGKSSNPKAILVLNLCLLLNISCQSKQTQTEKPNTTTSQSELSTPALTPPAIVQSRQLQMQTLSTVVARLIPYFETKKSLNQKDQNQVQSAIEDLSRISHVLKSTVKDSEDPLYKSASTQLSMDASFALENLKRGENRVAVQVSRRVVGLCISCHTQTELGAGIYRNIWDATPATLAPIELANLYLATRQYDKALDAYDHALISTDVRTKDSAEWILGTTRSLAIAIRVRKNPNLALEVVARLFDANSVPAHLDSTARKWRRDIVAWRNEIANEITKEAKDEPSHELDNGNFSKLNKVRALVQPAFEHRDHVEHYLIPSLRASYLLHELINDRSLPSETRGQVFFEAGRVAEILDQIDITNPSTLYYEACMRVVPYSLQAKKCYEHYEKNVRFNYKTYKLKGHLPDSLRSYLAELKALAKPK